MGRRGGGGGALAGMGDVGEFMRAKCGIVTCRVEVWDSQEEDWSLKREDPSGSGL